MPNEFTALTSLHAPGTLVAGYRRGDEIKGAVIDAWGLEEGTDYVAGDLPADGAPAPVARPADEANRAEWEAYARANGMAADDAAGASIEDLQAVEPDAPADDYPRPADSAKKAEWVTYVSNHPKATDRDKQWAGEEGTTKANLMEWQPSEPEHSGDPIAESASEAING